MSILQLHASINVILQGVSPQIFKHFKSHTGGNEITVRLAIKITFHSNIQMLIDIPLVIALRV